MSKIKITFLVIAGFVLGILIGGYLFRGVQPRSMIALDQCHATCLKSSDFIGLLSSVVLQNLDSVTPFVTHETEKTVVLKHPFPEARIHYLILPKKDIKDIGTLTPDDEPYLQDAFATMIAIIKEQNLQDYRIITNGPGFQHATRLHFHLRAN